MKRISSKRSRSGRSGVHWTFSIDLKAWFWALWFVLTLAFATWSWRGENGFLQFWRLRETRQKQERDNRLLQAENDEFRRKILLIKEDLSFIEWLARRDLGMIGEEEFLYWFED